MTSLRNLGVFKGYLGAIRVHQWPVWDLLGYPEATVRLQMPLRLSMNLDLSTSKPHLVFQISQLVFIAQKMYYIQKNTHGSQFSGEKKTVCKSIIWFTRYNNSCDEDVFLRFLEHPV